MSRAHPPQPSLLSLDCMLSEKKASLVKPLWRWGVFLTVSISYMEVFLEKVAFILGE